jgi:hypothetical protein
MIIVVVRINNRLYEQSLKKQGYYSYRKGKKDHSRKHTLYVDYIELDTTSKQPSKEEID